MDRVAADVRSRIMSRIRSTGTRPERVVRDVVRRLRRRFRSHARDLPGTPDFVFQRSRKVVFVHGCFWHRHLCLNGRATPATHVRYWSAKFEANRRRDRRVRRRLLRLGWDVLIVWECQTTEARRGWLVERVDGFLARSPRRPKLTACQRLGS